MLQAILTSKVFELVKKYWQIVVGAGAVVFAFAAKVLYDKNIRKQVIKEVEDVSRETMYREQKALDDASEAVLIDHVSNPLPSDWAKLDQLSKKTRPSAKSKVAKDKILRKLRRKD